MKIVMSIGGSLLTKELTIGNFKKYADVVLSLKRKGHKLVVICGGGKVCRDYRDIAKGFTDDVDALDFLGITATHINAATLVTAFGSDGYLVRWKSLKEAVKEVKQHFGKEIIVGGGYDVGTSSDFDAAAFAEAVGADLLINATNIDGVYNDDPKRNPGARKIPRMSHKEFEKIILQNPQIPGEYRLFDLAAVRVIKKMKLKTIFIDGSDPEEIVRAVEGTHNGTVVE